ncbi:transposase [Streptomyces cyslabdanicus]|uniref:transposase n=1 Tax=Streptomyces cyslabdanicus TaxID=1470456 RepID=UPI004044614B
MAYASKAFLRTAMARLTHEEGLLLDVASGGELRVALHAGVPAGRIRKRKRWREFLGLLKALRARWPGGKLYVVLDNFSPHGHAEVRAWTAGNDIELVFLPTCGSWLNWIESEFAALRYFALNGTDYRSHGEQNAAIAAYIRRRNARTEPKTNFAPDSPVRQWTEYPSRAA